MQCCKLNLYEVTSSLHEGNQFYIACVVCLKWHNVQFEGD